MTKVIDTFEHDGTEYETIETGDGAVITRRTYEEQKQNLFEPVEGEHDPYIQEVDVDWLVFHDLADRKYRDVSHVYVTSDLLHDFAERIDEQSGHKAEVRLDVSRNLPLIATLEDNTELALAPRDTR